MGRLCSWAPRGQEPACPPADVRQHPRVCPTRQGHFLRGPPFVVGPRGAGGSRGALGCCAQLHAGVGAPCGAAVGTPGGEQSVPHPGPSVFVHIQSLEQLESKRAMATGGRRWAAWP